MFRNCWAFDRDHSGTDLYWIHRLSGKPKQGPPPPPAVTVVQLVKRTVTDSLELTGNTQAVNTVQLVARVAGYLEKVFFQDGQTVKKGDLLFLIQQNTYQENLRQAEAAILLQKSQLEYAQSQLDCQQLPSVAG